MSANVSVPLGKFVLAAAVKMPPGPDGKADARQVLVFIGGN